MKLKNVSLAAQLSLHHAKVFLSSASNAAHLQHSSLSPNLRTHYPLLHHSIARAFLLSSVQFIDKLRPSLLLQLHFTPCLITVLQHICCYCAAGVISSTGRAPCISEWTTQSWPRNGKRRRAHVSTTRKTPRQRMLMRSHLRRRHQPTRLRCSSLQRPSSPWRHALHRQALRTGLRHLLQLSLTLLKRRASQQSPASYQSPTSPSATAPSRPQAPPPPPKGTESPLLTRSSTATS